MVLALYYLLPTLRIRNVLLIIVSLLFYAYGEPVYVLLMIASIIINYIFGRLLGTENKETAMDSCHCGDYQYWASGGVQVSGHDGTDNKSALRQ